MVHSSIEGHIASLVRNAIQDVLQDKAIHFPKSKRRKLVVANWKMNMTYRTARQYFEQFNGEGAEETAVVFCPPFTLLHPMHLAFQENKLPFLLGAQNVHWENKGAHTGEISAEMLQELACEFVIIGHSERRLAGETDEQINTKMKQVIANQLKPILCIGETLEEKEQGLTAEVIKNQLLEALADIHDIAEITIAYEPVWAIGSGVSASPEQAQAVHEVIREIVSNRYGQAADSLPILYGGSVKPENAGNLAMMPDIDGLLVGGASLIAEDFSQIVNSFSQKG